MGRFILNSSPLPLSLHDVEEGAEFEGGFVVFSSGFGGIDDAGAGKESGATAFDQGGTEGDDHLAFVAVVKPADGSGVESTVNFFEGLDLRYGGFSGGAANGGSGMQFSDDIEQVHARIDLRGNFGAEVLHVGEGQKAGMGRGFAFQSAGGQSAEDGVAHTSVFVEVFFTLQKVASMAGVFPGGAAAWGGAGDGFGQELSVLQAEESLGRGSDKAGGLPATKGKGKTGTEFFP